MRSDVLFYYVWTDSISNFFRVRNFTFYFLNVISNKCNFLNEKKWLMILIFVSQVLPDLNSIFYEIIFLPKRSLCPVSLSLDYFRLHNRWLITQLMRHEKNRSLPGTRKNKRQLQLAAIRYKWSHNWVLNEHFMIYFKNRTMQKHCSIFYNI